MNCHKSNEHRRENQKNRLKVRKRILAKIKELLNNILFCERIMVQGAKNILLFRFSQLTHALKGYFGETLLQNFDTPFTICLLSVVSLWNQRSHLIFSTALFFHYLSDAMKLSSNSWKLVG